MWLEQSEEGAEREEVSSGRGEGRSHRALWVAENLGFYLAGSGKHS